MIVVRNVVQHSEEWRQLRCGVITMSNAGALLTGGAGIVRHNYLLDVAAEKLSGVPTENVVTKDMQRGIDLEPYAIKAYQLIAGIDVKTIGFAFKDEDRRIGCSPDGVIGLSDEGAVEIKCPKPRNHLRYIEQDSARMKHAPQMQGNLWVLDAKWIDFVSFCPDFVNAPIFKKRYYRDDSMISRISASASAAVDEVDRIVERIKAETYDRRKELDDICGDARSYLQMLADDSEVKL